MTRERKQKMTTKIRIKKEWERIRKRERRRIFQCIYQNISEEYISHQCDGYTKKSLWRPSLEKRKKVEKLLTFDSSLSAGAPTHWMSAGIFTPRRKRDQASVTSLADVYCRRAGVTSVAKNWRRGGSPLFTPASGCVTAGWRSGKRRERKKLVSVCVREGERERWFGSYLNKRLLPVFAGTCELTSILSLPLIASLTPFTGSVRIDTQVIPVWCALWPRFNPQLMAYIPAGQIAVSSRTIEMCEMRVWRRTWPLSMYQPNLCNKFY